MVKKKKKKSSRISTLSKRQSISSISSKSSDSRPSSKALSKEQGMIARVEAALYEKFKPIHLSIQNISCWYVQRRLLGSKRFWHCTVTQENVSKQWTVTMYEAPFRKDVRRIANDAGPELLKRIEAKIKPTIVGQFETEEKAIRASLQAFRVRNRSNPLISSSEDDSFELDTHYKIVIVSELFKRKSQQERLSDIYNCLLDTIGGNGIAQASYLPKIHTIGSAVKSLPWLRSLDHNFLIEAKTPAQYDPDTYAPSATDRYGSSYSIPTSLSVPERAASKLRDVMSIVGTTNERHDHQSHASVFGHFYHSLPPKVKKMLLKSESKKASKYATNTEDSIGKKFSSHRRVLRRASQMLSQIFRSKFQFQTIRRINRENYYTIVIQRSYRAFRDRVFAAEYRDVMNIASLLIQSVYRGWKSRLRTARLRRILTDAVRRLQPFVRGYLGRKYFQWVKSNHEKVLKIQSIFRGFLCRTKAALMRKAMRHTNLIVPSSMVIQRAWRHYVGKKQMARLIQEQELVKVTLPSIVLIQRMFRGMKGRVAASKVRHSNNCALKIQSAYKRFRHHRLRNLVLHARARDVAVTLIQSVGRGYITRKLMKRRARKRHYYYTIIPAATTIQSLVRGYQSRIRTYRYKVQVDAAKSIQLMWRTHHRIQQTEAAVEAQAHEVQSSVACVIQRAIRCHIARKTLNTLLLASKGKAINAAVVLQCAWRSYVQRTRAAELRKMLTIERFASRLTYISDETELVVNDMEDANNDLELVRRKIKRNDHSITDLKKIMADMEARLPEISKELKKMTAEDVHRGWAEVFVVEKALLVETLGLATEDIRSFKVRATEFHDELEEFELEVEDLEGDYDEIMLAEVLNLEAVRRVEVTRATEAAALDLEASVRKQRNKWKVKSTRRNVIRRSRIDRHREALEEIKKAHKTTALGSISFTKNQSRRDQIRGEFNKRVRAEQVTTLKEATRKGFMNSVMRRTFDKISSDVVLRKVSDFCHGSHANVTDIRSDRTKMCWECGLIFCQCGAGVASPKKRTAGRKKTRSNNQ